MKSITLNLKSEEGIQIADFITIHMPLNEETKNLINNLRRVLEVISSPSIIRIF